MSTFYIASSSDPDNIPVVRALADELQVRGWSWTFDWTSAFDSEPEQDHEKIAAAAEVDIEAARSADLFIFLRAPVISRGSHIELGVRLGTKQQIHLIGGAAYFFFHHELIKSYGNEQEFLSSEAWR